MAVKWLQHFFLGSQLSLVFSKKFALFLLSFFWDSGALMTLHVQYSACPSFSERPVEGTLFFFVLLFLFFSSLFFFFS
jgi:hypothetical protein